MASSKSKWQGTTLVRVFLIILRRFKMRKVYLGTLESFMAQTLPFLDLIK